MKEENLTQHGDAIHIGEVITQLLASYQLQPQFDTAYLVSSWENFVGVSIAKNTKRVSVCEKTLFVEMKSAALKHDLSFLKDKILTVLKKKVGDGVIDKIVLL